MDVPGAVGEAKRYITEAVRCAWRVGGGYGPTNHLAPLFSTGTGGVSAKPEAWKTAG
jgi:hypothetical protein